MNPDGRFDPWHDRLPFYVAGTLPAAERLALDEHLRDCAICRAGVTSWREIAEAVRAEAVARVPEYELLPLNISTILSRERTSPMIAQKLTIAERSVQPSIRRLKNTGWLSLSASLLIIALVAALALGVFAPLLNNPRGFSGVAAQSSATPPQLGELPSDCPPAPLAMNVNPDVGVAVGGYPLWVTMISYSAALKFYGKDQYTSDGWPAKVIWSVQTEYQGELTVHGANLKDGTPLKFDPFPNSASGSVSTTLKIDTRALNVSPTYLHWVSLPGAIYVSEAGCYALEMDWPGGSWRITFPAGQVTSAMQTATMRTLPTIIPSSVPSLTPDCKVTSLPLDSVFKATEMALPSPPPLTPGQTPPPLPTFAPIPIDQLRPPGCPPPTPNLTASPIPICATSVSGVTPTASPTASAPGGIEIDCLPYGTGVYLQLCPATVPLGNSRTFRYVWGPPFPPCSEPFPMPTSTLIPSPTLIGTPIPIDSPTLVETPTTVAP